MLLRAIILTTNDVVWAMRFFYFFPKKDRETICLKKTQMGPLGDTRRRKMAANSNGAEQSVNRAIQTSMNTSHSNIRPKKNGGQQQWG